MQVFLWAHIFQYDKTIEFIPNNLFNVYQVRQLYGINLKYKYYDELGQAVHDNEACCVFYVCSCCK